MQNVGGQTKSIMVFSEVTYMTVQPLVMVNYACGFTQILETGKYFEWIIMINIFSL